MRMKRNFLKRFKNSGGFTLSEVLIVVLILLLVSLVVAAGVPAALRSLQRVVDSANAQVLLSTTVTRLRDELSTARNVKVDDDNITITYTSETGSLSILTVEDKGIWLQEYADVTDLNFKHPLTSDSAANKNLYAVYEEAKYENGLITITGLKAVRQSDETVTFTLDDNEDDPAGVVIRVLTA